MAKRAAARSGVDNLSRLSDELLLVIISLLPMKDAVRTSVLSTRWRYLYASSSNLDFDFRFRSVPSDVMNVVDRVFFYRKSFPIKKFSFGFSELEAFDPSRFEGWIKCVMCHGILEISLDVPSGLLVPSSLFTCETLVKLYLNLSSQMGPVLEVPAKVFLPSLKVLSLDTVISFHKDDDAAERLLSNCPALEDLCCCIQDNECRIIVSNPMLKRFHVIDRRLSFKGVNSFEIVINSPNLVCLAYYVCDVDSHRLTNFQSLSEASISFSYRSCNVDNHILAATDLMRGISRVRELSLSGETVEDLLQLKIPIPMFYNTTDLTISDDLLLSFSDLLYFLTFFENIESLHLQDLPSKFDLDASEEYEVSCFSFRLKEISLCSFRGKKREMKAVKYFLQNAKVLEVLKTDIYERDCEEQLEITKKLLAFPRISKTCSVVIDDRY